LHKSLSGKLYLSMEDAGKSKVSDEILQVIAKARKNCPGRTIVAR